MTKCTSELGHQVREGICVNGGCGYIPEEDPKSRYREPGEHALRKVPLSYLPSPANQLRRMGDTIDKYETLTRRVDDLLRHFNANHDATMKLDDISELRQAFDAIHPSYEVCPTGCGGWIVSGEGGGIRCTHCTYWFCY